MCHADHGLLPAFCQRLIDRGHLLQVLFRGNPARQEETREQAFQFPPGLFRLPEERGVHPEARVPEDVDRPGLAFKGRPKELRDCGPEEIGRAVDHGFREPGGTRQRTFREAPDDRAARRDELREVSGIRERRDQAGNELPGQRAEPLRRGEDAVRDPGRQKAKVRVGKAGNQQLHDLHRRLPERRAGRGPVDGAKERCERLREVHSPRERGLQDGPKPGRQALRGL